MLKCSKAWKFDNEIKVKVKLFKNKTSNYPFKPAPGTNHKTPTQVCSDFTKGKLCATV